MENFSSTPSSTLNRIIIDTDAGVDDAMAVLLALLSPNECKVEAITTVAGNVPLEQATENVFRFLDMFQKVAKESTNLYHPLPKVFKGEGTPLKRALNTATHVHGLDGLGGSTSLTNQNGEIVYPKPSMVPLEPIGAPEAILNLLEENPNQITIVTLGPLTNLAKAALLDVEKLKKAKEVIIMGGAFEHYGNVNLSAEYNIWADPESLAIVLESGVKLTMVPLDVTEKVWLSASLIEQYLSSSPLATYFLDICENGVFKFKRLHGAESDGVHMHDPLSVGIALRSDIIPNYYKKSAPIVVECQGTYTSGKTLANLRKALTNDKDANPHHHTICVSVHEEKFLEFFTERIFKLNVKNY